MGEAAMFETAAGGHRVLRTFGFVDIGGFTAYANAEGDDRAVEQLSEFRRIVRGVGSATGIRIAKWLGDGAMLIGLEPVSLISAVFDIMRKMRNAELDLPLHAGLAQGRTILFEGDDHIGSTVNLAARLADAAGAWQIFAPTDTLPGLTNSDAPIGTIEIAGFPDPIDVADLSRVEALIRTWDL